MDKYKDWCRFIKSKYMVKIQRRRVNKNIYGWYKNNLIVVDRNADEDLAIWIVTHELGHMLAEGKEKKDHDRAFVHGYFLAYKCYLEWVKDKEK